MSPIVVLAFLLAAVTSPPRLWGLLLVAVALFTVVHEALHVGLFVVFGDRPRVQVRGVSIATVGGERLLTRGQMCVVLLTPVVLLVPAAVVLMRFGAVGRVLGLGGLIVTVFGSRFDVVAAVRVARRPATTRWRDAQEGFESYVPVADAELTRQV